MACPKFKTLDKLFVLYNFYLFVVFFSSPASFFLKSLWFFTIPARFFLFPASFFLNPARFFFC